APRAAGARVRWNARGARARPPRGPRRGPVSPARARVPGSLARARPLLERGQERAFRDPRSRSGAVDPDHAGETLYGGRAARALARRAGGVSVRVSRPGVARSP